MRSGKEMSAYHRWGKRGLDVLALLAASPFVLPVVIVVALVVRLQMGSPVFFRQVRPGYKAKPFTLLKFRTMNSVRDKQGSLLSDEKRLTKLGELLRRYSMDEIPQLWNVLKGEMSLVGPRPLLMQYLNRYTAEQARRHEVKPGVTGWAQANGRNALSWEERFQLDVWYVDHWSIWLDLRIIAKTIRKVYLREGISKSGHATVPEFIGNKSGEMTNMQKVFVYGASGHGKVVADILLACKDSRLAGFVDDRVELQSTSVLGLPVLGDGRWLQQEAGRMRIAVALGVGDNCARQRVAEKCLGWGLELVTLVHPTAIVSESAQLGPGTVVMAQAVVNPAAVTGSGVIVNTGAVVEHDVEIGEFAHVSPNAAMGGTSRLGKFSHLGIGAVVIQCVSIGVHTIVGAGAVVTRDIPDGVVAFGVPAQIHRTLETS
jgi:sugar O-acyltransferase (sialic acid O-acetyltransferase NeuD family)